MDWATEYNRMLMTLPEGETLYGDRVRLQTVVRDGEEPLMFVIAYVPCVVGGKVEWRLRTLDEERFTGVKVLIESWSRDVYVNKHGLPAGPVAVSGVKIVRRSRKNPRALIGTLLPVDV